MRIGNGIATATRPQSDRCGDRRLGDNVRLGWNPIADVGAGEFVGAARRQVCCLIAIQIFLSSDFSVVDPDRSYGWRVRRYGKNS